MSGTPGDSGLLLTVLEGGFGASMLSALGAGIAWLINRRDRRAKETMAAAEKSADRDDDEALEERRFLDERSRREIVRIERERDEARQECRSCHDAREQLREQLQGRIDLSRENWSVCMHEARRCQQLIVSMHRYPPERGSDPPEFELLPDPRNVA